MRVSSANAIVMVAAVLGVVLASPAAAVSVSYHVGGTGPMQFPAPTTPPANAPWGPDGYPGDTVELEAYVGTLDLTPGTSVGKVNTLLWTINYTYGGTATDPTVWSDLDFPVNAPRTMSVFNTNGALAQMGSLRVTWDNDTLSFSPGSTTDFSVSILGMLYVVHVTPLPFGPLAGMFENCSGGALWTRPARDSKCLPPWIQPMQDVMAQFVVEAPVPVSTTSWGHLKKLYW